MLNHILALIQKVYIVCMVWHKNVDLFINDFSDRLQINLAAVESGITDFQKIRLLKCIETKTALIAHTLYFFPVCHIKETGNHTVRMA